MELKRWLRRDDRCMTAPAPIPNLSSRIEIVDALRGSALLGLFLLHAVEHFEFGRYPENSPAWLHALDLKTTDMAYFLFGGKAYAIFAMMFGLSFFLIIDRAARKGLDFRWRFMWRCCVLTAIGYVFGILYCGEILTMLAILGLPLVFLYKLPTRVLAWLSVLLLLQLPFIVAVVRLSIEPGYVPFHLNVGGYYRELNAVFGEKGLFDVCKINVWTGVLARWSWSIENGRYLQMLGLFIWGLLVGRSRLFENPEASKRVAKRVFAVGLVAFAVLYYAKLNVNTWPLPDVQRRLVRRLVFSYCDLAQMTIWASGFVLLYYYTKAKGVLNLLAPYGRTSLTCYVSQSLVGMLLFYHFGFGLFRQWGQFYSILYGVGFFVLQCAAAHWWMKHFYYGPLEWFWRCCTQLSFKSPIRRRASLPVIAVPVESAVG